MFVQPPISFPCLRLSKIWNPPTDRFSLRVKVTEYARSTAPYVSADAKSLATSIETLLTRLRKFELTKPEVLTIINHGVGLPLAHQSAAHPQAPVGSVLQEGSESHAQASVENPAPASPGANDQSTQDGAATKTAEEETESDMILLSLIVEEMQSRFKDGEAKEMLQICREVLAPPPAALEDDTP